MAVDDEAGVEYTWNAEGDVCPLNYKIYEAVIATVPAEGVERILDVGCGSGILCNLLSERGFDCTGLDSSESGIRAARNRFPELRFVEGSCYDERLPAELGSFDLVIASEVIEHLFNPRRFLKVAKSYLAPGGLLLLTTPDYSSYWRNLFLSLANRWDVHHSPLWDGGHIKFWSRKTLSTILRECGFEPVAWRGVRSLRVPVFNASMVCLCKQRCQPDRARSPAGGE